MSADTSTTTTPAPDGAAADATETVAGLIAGGPVGQVETQETAADTDSADGGGADVVVATVEPDAPSPADGVEADPEGSDADTAVDVAALRARLAELEATEARLRERDEELGALRVKLSEEQEAQREAHAAQVASLSAEVERMQAQARDAKLARLGVSAKYRKAGEDGVTLVERLVGTFDPADEASFSAVAERIRAEYPEIIETRGSAPSGTAPERAPARPSKVQRAIDRMRSSIPGMSAKQIESYINEVN